MDRHITTHILDTSRGTPAAGVKIELWRLAPRREVVAEAITNDDGRTNAPLIAGDALTTGTYELLFHVAAYFADAHPEGEYFYDVVPVRFVIFDNPSAYHIPLLLSPFGYSTYRGS